MADSQIFPIGSVEQFRGVYNSAEVYYYKNVITMYGSVFRAKANNFSNVPPLTVADDGTVSLTNNYTWDVVVDNTALYNATLSKAPLADQVKALQTNYDSLKASLDTETKGRTSGDNDIKAMIGNTKGKGIASLTNGKIDLSQIPDDVTSVVMLDTVVTTPNTNVVFPDDAKTTIHYYYDAYNKKLYSTVYIETDEIDATSGKTTVKSIDQHWEESTMEKNKIYINKTNADMYLYKEGDGLIKVFPQSIPKLVYLTQDEYDSLVNTGKIDKETYYNVVEE